MGLRDAQDNTDGRFVEVGRCKAIVGRRCQIYVRQMRPLRCPESWGAEGQSGERVIFPHALIHAGTRWHVRAWCTLRQGYRDFNLSRI